jgi:hypothetical protein
MKNLRCLNNSFGGYYPSDTATHSTSDWCSSFGGYCLQMHVKKSFGGFFGAGLYNQLET